MPQNVQPYRLGDILVRNHQIKPYQLGVALSVQKTARVPLGEILIANQLLSPLQLRLALWRQRWVRLLNKGQVPSKGFRLYGIELITRGRELLDRHMAAQYKSTDGEPLPVELSETLRLRSELAHLHHRKAARIVDKDHVVKERILTGSL